MSLILRLQEPRSVIADIFYTTEEYNFLGSEVGKATPWPRDRGCLESHDLCDCEIWMGDVRWSGFRA